MRLAAFAAASVVVHGVALLASAELVWDELAPPVTAREARPVVLELLPPPRPGDEGPPEAMPRSPVDAPTDATVPVRNRRRVRPPGVVRIAVAPVEVDSLGASSAVVTRSERTASRLPRIPSPRAAAIAALTLDHGGPESRDDTEAALEAELSDALRPAPLIERRELSLRRLGNGAYRYEGTTIRATIRPDGTVEFDDPSAPSAQLGPEAPPSARGAAAAVGARREIPPSGDVPGREPTLAPSLTILSGRFPGVAGGGPEATEEAAWFLEQTEELRERLTDAPLVRERRRGRVALERQLSRIWRGGGSAIERRRRIFELWDDCAEDDVGAVARSLITRWIARRLPASGPAAYTRDELRVLDRDRVSADRFAPYRALTSPDP